ncbi:centromere protein c [Phtheirospermum japonicum]|uniref:Centromere protein c n=1 Tax=Phtheirospermum japonicum TaxID=374723 RepID=A0A830D6Q2_9LAMI|nr:centromere protein c [Phtheirospermum japonicum]
MRKSLAEAGTSFETRVRRSKRIRMRPLEFWKGERFLYGPIFVGKKLLGVKYISSGKGNGKLKVKPFILSESAKFKEELDNLVIHTCKSGDNLCWESRSCQISQSSHLSYYSYQVYDSLHNLLMSYFSIDSK